MRLDTVIDKISGLPFGATDCALPMEYAIKNKREVDVFVIYTDSETNAFNSRQPAEALRDYRRKTGIDAKLIVVGMVSNGFFSQLPILVTQGCSNAEASTQLLRS